MSIPFAQTESVLLNLEKKALNATQDLAKALQELSDYHWGNETVNPVIRPKRGTMDVVKGIKATIMKLIREIEAAL